MGDIRVQIVTELKRAELSELCEAANDAIEGGGVTVTTGAGAVEAGAVVNCAGLQADRTMIAEGKAEVHTVEHLLAAANAQLIRKLSGASDEKK